MKSHSMTKIQSCFTSFSFTFLAFMLLAPLAAFAQDTVWFDRIDELRGTGTLSKILQVDVSPDFSDSTCTSKILILEKAFFSSSENYDQIEKMIISAFLAGKEVKFTIDTSSCYQPGSTSYRRIKNVYIR